MYEIWQLINCGPGMNLSALGRCGVANGCEGSMIVLKRSVGENFSLNRNGPSAQCPTCFSKFSTIECLRFGVSAMSMGPPINALAVRSVHVGDLR